MNSSLRTKALLVMLCLFLLWSGWLMISLGGERHRQNSDANVVERLQDIGQALAGMREASVSIADVSKPDSDLTRWRSLYLGYRAAVNGLDGKNASVQKVMDDLIQVYAYVTRTEKIRQQLIRGGLQPEESRQLESEFRSNINLALSAVKQAEYRLQYPVETIPAAQRTGIYVALGAACLLTLLAGALLVVSDRRIARLEETEHMLNDAVARGSSVEGAVSEGILTLDDQGQIRSANPAVEKMFGYGADELYGLDLRDLVPDAFLILHTGVRELAARRKDASQFPVDCEVKRVPLETGTLLLAFVRDVTDRVRAETPLSQAQRMDLSIALCGRFAHNFNNLLTSITGYADLLTYTVDEKDPIRKDLEEIKKAGDRAASLTAQMLAFSGKQVLRYREVELNPLVRKAVGGLQPLLGDSVSIQSSIDSSVGEVKADPQQIEQVILKLAVNARDAMPEGGRLSIQTRSLEVDAINGSRLALTPGDYAVIEIRDTGSGMDEDTQAHLFEPFFTTKKAGRGMGLGLPSSWGIVRQCGGVIRAESSPGQGSTFRIYLPQHRSTQKPKSAKVISALFQEKTGQRR